MNKSNKLRRLFFIILFLFIINYFLIKYFGKLYLRRLDSFVNENNSITIKKIINNVIKKNNIILDDDLYSVSYNENNEIVSLNLNTSKINTYLSNYLIKMEETSDLVSNNYLDKYYKYLNLRNNHKYYLIPLGTLSDNPFLFNLGPKIIMMYDYVNVFTIKIDLDVKNYGLNNALVETYLNIHVDQTIFKPILSTVSTYDYRFLISSKIINGRVSNYLGTNIKTESDSISNT